MHLRLERETDEIRLEGALPAADVLDADQLLLAFVLQRMAACTRQSVRAMLSTAADAGRLLAGEQCVQQAHKQSRSSNIALCARLSFVAADVARRCSTIIEQV